jgi:hypothetical protein
MLTRRDIVLGVASACALSPVSGSAASITRSSYNLLFCPVDVGGQPALALLDSGSSHALQMTPALATTLAIALQDSPQASQRYAGGRRPQRSGRVQHITIAGARFDGVDVDVIEGDIQNISRQVNTDFDAILGWPLLSSRAFGLNYSTPALEFVAADKSGITLACTDSARVPIVPVWIAGQVRMALLDTGAPKSKVDASIGDPAKLGQSLPLAVRLGEQEEQHLFQVRDLGALARGTGAAAVLGNDLLSRFEIFWSPTKRSFTLV